MIHITQRFHVISWSKSALSLRNMSVKMEIYNVKNHLTLSQVKYKVEKSKKMGGSALWTGPMHGTLRVYKIKIVLKVNSGILHHHIYSKTWDWTSKQSTLLLIRAILILPKKRRQLNWINNSGVKNSNIPQLTRRQITNALGTKSAVEMTLGKRVIFT